MFWIKRHLVAILFSLVSALVAGMAMLFVMWRGAENEADAQRELAEGFREVIKAQTLISQNENRVDNAANNGVRVVLETPNANAIIPPDVADAWLDGVNSLRDDPSRADERNAELSGPASGDANKRRVDSRTAGGNVNRTGSGVPKMQLSPRASSKASR